jgi:two-component system invasion response regulator UvrY
MIKLLIVDDHKLIREGLEELLKNEESIIIAGKADSGQAAIELSKDIQPDVVLMDIQMPGMDGLETTKNLLFIKHDLKVLALTACSSDVISIRFIQEGGMGYLTKNAEVSEILDAIQSVYAGKRYISPSITQKIAETRLDYPKYNDSLDCLSSRELQVMMLMVKGIKLRIIADKLDLSYKTVATYRGRIYEKLKIKSDAELTVLAIRHGLLDINHV